MEKAQLHSFVICAYKDSPYIEECICSLKGQTVVSPILLATSTPSPYLERLCGKYQIPYCVRKGEPGIAYDWNYALSVADTPYVTIAHQDDLYEPAYAEKIRMQIQQCESAKRKILILFTDYSELVNGIKYPNRRNLKVKRILLWGIRNPKRQGKRFWKRQVLRFGNAIACPCVTYHKSHIDELLKKQCREHLFKTQFRSNLDWQAWEWLSSRQGSFIYIPEVLAAHRIHEESETTAVIQDKGRRQEDYEMFCKFWPKWVAQCLTGFYSASEQSNEV